MRASSEAAVAQADLVLFVVDARAGIMPADEHFAAWLRRQGAPILLVVNKAEGRAGANAALEAYSLGLGEPVGVSAEHGDGLGRPDERDRRSAAARAGIRPQRGAAAEARHRRPPECRQVDAAEPPPAGRGPHADRAGARALTRDSIAVQIVDSDGSIIELVDTAGLRKKARIEQDLGEDVRLPPRSRR